MVRQFDVFFQPQADKVRVMLDGKGNPAALSDDEELLREYWRRFASSEEFRLLVNRHEDYLAGKAELAKLPF